MNTRRLPISFDRFIQSLKTVKKDKNQLDLTKEEIILTRLERKLGKSKEEVSRLISKDLMYYLTQVPFTNKTL